MILEVLVSSSGLDLLGVPWPLPKKKCLCSGAGAELFSTGTYDEVLGI